MQQINKTFFTITLIFLATFSTNVLCQFDITLKQEQKEYNAIKLAKILSVTQVQFKYSDGKLNTDGQNLLYNKFDSAGKCINWIKYWPDGSKIEETNQYAYNEKGYITGITSISMDGHVDTRTENAFDVNGNLIETDKYDTGGALMTTWTHKYDDKGRETGQIILKGADPIPLRKVYIYDNSINTIETDFFRQDTLTYKHITQYNKDNNPVEEEQFTPSGEHTRHILYSYDSTGCQTENKTYFGDGRLISLTKYKHDRFGNILEEVKYNSKEEPESLVKYNYEYSK